MVNDPQQLSAACPCRGQKVAGAKAEVDALLDYLNVRGDNPVAVMSQDHSRTFLTGNSAKADCCKFDLFMEATMLTDAFERQEWASECVRRMKCLLEEFEEQMLDVKVW